jgi:hypothetical protein
MLNGQSEFRSCCLIETFSAKAAMPRHPTSLDDPVKAVGVIRAEDVPRSLVRGGIRFGFLHLTLLSAPRQNLDRSRKKQILSQGALNAFIDIAGMSRAII